MTTLKLRPALAAGRVEAPPSKSYTHRALVAAHLTGRAYTIHRPLESDDTLATAHGLMALGSDVRRSAGSWVVAPSAVVRRSRIVRCGSSGTTLRFLSALAALRSDRVRFVGDPQLSRRPMAGLLESLRGAGVEVTSSPRGTLPIRIRGPIRPGAISVDGAVSSQYVSALLLALPALNAPSELRVEGLRVSEPYVEATAAVLRAHGIQCRGRNGRWTIPAPQRYRGRTFRVPGDASSAAYLWAAGAVTGGPVRVDGVPRSWPQADRAILEVLRSAGAQVHETSDGATVGGGLEVGFDVDLTPSPDLYPLVGVLAGLTPGRSVIRGAAHVVFKESNRRATTVALVRSMGAQVRESSRRLVIDGTLRPKALRLRGSDDHRVVMSAAVAALRADGPSTLSDAHAVAKSFPTFWAVLRELVGRGVISR